MQKLITLTINIEKLQESSKSTFTVNEVEEVNALLEEGWAVEEWEFITGDKEDEKAVVLLMLNDELHVEMDGDADYSLRNFDEKDHELFNDDADDPEAALTDEDGHDAEEDEDEKSAG